MEIQNNITQDGIWREFTTILSTCRLSVLLFFSVKNDLITYIEINLDTKPIKISVLRISTFDTDFDMLFWDYMSQTNM